MLAATAHADPKPKPIDTKPFRDKLVVLRDGKGGTYAVLLEGASGRLFYGTGQTLHEQLVASTSHNGDSWLVYALAPRVAQSRSGAVGYKQDHTYALFCGDRETALAPVTGDQAKQIVGKSTFLTTALVRRAHLLARDDHGVYYYVDALRDGGKGFRVFVGRKGAMKPQPIVDLTTDATGEVFVTKAGELQLALPPPVSADGPAQTQAPTASWSHGDQKLALHVLDVSPNLPLIYGELGVYTFTGTICDEP
jgi:hypothetical protein